MIRAPIIAVLGHVDHGKTTLLDKIRSSAIATKEPGSLTQWIGCSEIPVNTIKKICKPLEGKMNLNFFIPSLIFIDTPGHEAFTNLRKRGGSISDFAILVISLIDGIQEQTKEAIEILKTFKVPFVVAATKLDLISGWQSKEGCFIDSFKEQNERAKMLFEEKLANLIIQLQQEGFESDLFTRVNDFTKTVAIVPVSGITGEGIPELLALITGLVQKYLKDNLKIEVNGPGKGVILEVKEVIGLGKTIDVLLYDGILKEKDTIVVGGKNEPIVTKVKAILKPEPLCEIRESICKFRRIKEVVAASGIKIAANGLDNAVAGMPLLVANSKEEVEKAVEEVSKEIESIKFESPYGIVIKADALGTLEAIVKIAKEKGINVKKADIGDVSRKDVLDVVESKSEDEFSCIFAFNVKVSKEIENFAKSNGVKIIASNIIYRLFEEYEEWKKKVLEERIKEELKEISIAKIRVLPGYVFRQSKPAVFGIEVIGGVLKKGAMLMDKEGKFVGKLLRMESMGEEVNEVGRNFEVAISVDKAVIGKNVKENDILYTMLSEEQYKKIKEKLIKFLSDEEKEVLEEIVEIRRKVNPLWGI